MAQLVSTLDLTQQVLEGLNNFEKHTKCSLLDLLQSEMAEFSDIAITQGNNPSFVSDISPDEFGSGMTNLSGNQNLYQGHIYVNNKSVPSQEPFCYLGKQNSNWQCSSVQNDAKTGTESDNLSDLPKISTPPYYYPGSVSVVQNPSVHYTWSQTPIDDHQVKGHQNQMDCYTPDPNYSLLLNEFTVGNSPNITASPIIKVDQCQNSCSSCEHQREPVSQKKISAGLTCNSPSSQEYYQPRSRKNRTYFTTEQLNRLEDFFRHVHYPDFNQREALAKELGFTEEVIQIWFKNRRAKISKTSCSNRDITSSKHLEQERGAKRTRKNRATFTPNQLKELEASFQQDKYPDIIELENLSQQLGLGINVLRVWFKNNRAKLNKNK